MAEHGSHQAVDVDYRAMVDSILDTEIIMLDPEGRVLTWNAGARQLKGYEASEVVGRHVSMFYGDEQDATALAEDELRLAREAGRFEGEGWRTRHDGERFWAHVVIQPIRADGGALDGYVKVTRDLTRQREQENELRIASLMIDAITDYEVIMLDTDGTVLTWNRGAERVKGYTADEVVGRDVSMFYGPDDLASGLAQRELREALQTGRFESEGWRIRKGGERFLANVVITPIRDADGAHIGFVKVTQDVTERVEREKLLQRQRDDILELSTPVIQVWDRVLVLPIIGTLDSTRAARLTENLLERIAIHEAAIVILDISGVPMIDTAVAAHLFKTIQGARLMGAESVISGVRPETAQAIVNLGIDMAGIRSRSTLRDALQLAFALMGQRDSVDELPNPDGGREAGWAIR